LSILHGVINFDPHCVSCVLALHIGGKCSRSASAWCIRLPREWTDSRVSLLWAWRAEQSTIILLYVWQQPVTEHVQA